MHVISALSPKFYEVEIASKPAGMWDVFPDYNSHDRFGIVIYEPHAALGATHLIQLACMCFYDIKPSRREERKIYPEIYAIHVGSWWGMHGEMDFWPARREVRVSNDHRDVLGAINDRGITRLAIPERPSCDIVHRRKEEDCALDGLVTAVIYSPTGRVANPDFTIRSNDRRSERDVQRTIYPVQVPEQTALKLSKSAVPVKEGDADFVPRQMELNANITADIRHESNVRRETLKVNELVTETYRFVQPAQALKSL